MITDIDGIEVGHWTDASAMTGCTVALFPEGTVASQAASSNAPASKPHFLPAFWRIPS